MYFKEKEINRPAPNHNTTPRVRIIGFGPAPIFGPFSIFSANTNYSIF